MRVLHVGDYGGFQVVRETLAFEPGAGFGERCGKGPPPALSRLEGARRHDFGCFHQQLRQHRKQRRRIEVDSPGPGSTASSSGRLC